MGLFSKNKQYVSKKKYEEYKVEEAAIWAAIPGILDSFLDGIPIEGDWPFEGSLARAQLNGTLESLGKIDEYLNVLHENKETIGRQQIVHVVVAAGYYACEVVRKESGGIIGPVLYSDLYIRRNKFTELVDFACYTAILLQNNKTNAISMPLNKIGRFISDGPENFIRHFCSCEIASINKN